MSGVAFALYLAFICSWFLHLPARYPALASLRADLALVCIILVLTLISSAESRPSDSDQRTRRLLWALVIYAAITVPLVEWPGSVVKTGFPQFFKAFVFFYFTAALTTSARRLAWLLGVFLACQTFRVLEPLYLHMTEGYWGSAATMADFEMMNRLSGAPADIVNPNGLAGVILTVIPFLHYLTSGSRVGRLLYVTVVPLLLYALVLTGSRSGLIGLTGIAALVWIKSRHKILLTGAIAVAIVFTVPRLSPELADRYLSIVSSDSRNAATAEGRIDGLKLDLHVALRRPLFGHGLGTSLEANANFGARYVPSHNLYIEIAQELGVLGLVIFMAFVGSLLIGLRRAAAARAAEAPRVVRHLVPALQVWIGMNILFSFACYGLSSYDWYLAAGLTAVVARFTPANALPPIRRPHEAERGLRAAVRPLAVRA